jgi:glutamine amidotransferase
MSKKQVSIIDYGASNMMNVQHAFEYMGVEVTIASTPEEIMLADRLVFPGVGSFPEAMFQIEQKGLSSAIIESAKNSPFLGICLGMQLMLTDSSEFEKTKGLDLISGSVCALPKTNNKKQNLIIPHVGWSEIMYNESQQSIFSDVPNKSAFYFVHSFHAELADSSHQLATTMFDEFSITAMIQKENLIGCQFHPEKSGKLGLQLINNFLKI